jgi:hypothetical protein
MAALSGEKERLKPALTMLPAATALVAEGPMSNHMSLTLI